MRKIIYIYDALCPWCYAFTPVVRRLLETLDEGFEFEVLSGGLAVGDSVRTVGGEGDEFVRDYRAIEQRTGVELGAAFIERSERQILLDSLPPAVALAVFRESGSALHPLEFVHGLMRQIFVEGGDPNEDAFYLALAEEAGLDPERFVQDMHREEFRDKARYDFVLAKQLEAEAFPRLFLQTAEDYFHLISKGYSELETIQRVVDAILAET